MKAITRELNLELGRPTADEALRRLEAELEAARHMNTPLLKLIHGYGSSGKGGRIRTASRKYLLAQQEKGRIAAVVPGELRFQPVGGPLRTAAVSAGLVKVEAGEVMLLVSTAERPEDIDVNRARRAEDAAKEALLQKKSMQEHRNAEAQLARAISRLRIKEHWNSGR